MLIGTDTGVVSQGFDNPTPVDVGEIVLDPGVYGIYVHLFQGMDQVLWFSFGGPTVYVNAELSLTTNTGEIGGAFTGGSSFSREWNGTIHYEIAGPLVDADLSLGSDDDCFSLSSELYSVSPDDNFLRLIDRNNDPTCSFNIDCTRRFISQWP